MTKAEKREKAFSKIHSILEKAWEDISEIAETELGIEPDYDDCKSMHENISIAFGEDE